jgi:uncharacterized protein YjbI with pentapeptide repeats
MADEALLNLLKGGADAWNAARVNDEGRDAYERMVWGGDLSGASLAGANLRSAKLPGIDFSGADLQGADLTGVALHQGDLRNANLEGARLDGALLLDTKLCEANLRGASLRGAKIAGDKRFTYPSRIVGGADLSHATLARANLIDAEISDSRLIGTNLNNADVTGASLRDLRIDGISIWDLAGVPRHQSALSVTAASGRLEFDDLRAAVFFNLLSNGLSLGDVISISGRMSVLILGRFTDDDESDKRKVVIDAIRGQLTTLGYSPVVFDFERPDSRDLTETIVNLAGMSLFVIADLTRPRSVQLELQATIPNLMIPFVPILKKGEEPFSMFSDLLGKYDWVLDILDYDDLDKLMRGFKRAVVDPALEKHEELLMRKAQKRSRRSIDDVLE